jgi:hypothetical protein
VSGTDYTHAARERRLRARRKGEAKTRLGEDAALRAPGRVPRGDDSPFTMDQPLSSIHEWLVYRLDQQPPEDDPQMNRDRALYRAAVESWGRLFARREATALLRQ